MSTLLDRLKKGKTKTVAIPNSEEKVQIRSLTMREMIAFEKDRGAPDADHTALMIKILALAVVDETGEQVWADADVESLSDLPLSVIKHITEEAMTYSGATPKNA